MKKISFLLSLVLLAGCSAKNSDPAEESAPSESVVTLTDEQLKTASIELGGLEQRSLSSSLRVNGRIDVPPQNMISVSVPLGGYLKHTKLLPGMHVKRGEVIAVMEDQQYIQLQQDFLTAKAQLVFVSAEFNRQKELNISKASSDKVLQQAEADFTAQKINVKSLGEKLKLISINPDELSENSLSKSINIYSPINGYVSEVNVNIGKYTQPSEVLFELINPEDIHLALTIFEKDLQKISIGQKVIAYTNNQPEKKHVCEIILIGMNLNDNRSTEVHSHFEKYDKSLVPGMYMNAEIELKNSKAYTLAEEAIVRFENKQYIFVPVSATQFEMTEVTTGDSENGFVEIVNFSELLSKKVVVTGAYTLLMALKNKSEEE